MPNWCECDLTITGEPNEVKRFTDGIKPLGILETYVPMPKEMDIDDVMPTSPEMLSNKEKFGYWSWRDWSYEKWGTKWPEQELEVFNKSDKKVLCKFRTAWAPPLNGLCLISEQFSTLKFELRYYERGMAFKGYWVCKNGEVTTNQEFEYNGPRGG